LFTCKLQSSGFESFQEGGSGTSTMGWKYRDVLPGIKLTSYWLHRKVLLLLYILYVECWCEPL